MFEKGCTTGFDDQGLARMRNNPLGKEEGNRRFGSQGSGQGSMFDATIPQGQRKTGQVSTWRMRG